MKKRFLFVSIAIITFFSRIVYSFEKQLDKETIRAFESFGIQVGDKQVTQASLIDYPNLLSKGISLWLLTIILALILVFIYIVYSVIKEIKKNNNENTF